MRFEWNEQKNDENIRKHGLDFADAEEVFEGPLFYDADTREEHGEERWIGIGQIRGRVVVVVFTECGDDCVRIISLRKATKNERKQYEEKIKNELGLGGLS